MLLADMLSARSAVVPGTGLLLENAADLSAFGRTLFDLLAQPQVIDDLGARAHQRVLGLLWAMSSSSAAHISFNGLITV
jgi:hypothetical protein